jgi:hypothetical protein
MMINKGKLKHQKISIPTYVCTVYTIGITGIVYYQLAYTSTIQVAN